MRTSLIVSMLVVACGALTPPKRDGGAGGDAGGTASGGTGGSGGGFTGTGGRGGGKGVGGGVGAVGGGVQVDSGWPVTEVPAAGFTFTQLDAFSLRDTAAITVWNDELYGTDATGPLWRRSGGTWQVVNSMIGAAAGQLAAHADGPMVFALTSQKLCDATCRAGGASRNYATGYNVVLVCRGAMPLKVQTNLGGVGAFTGSGWMPIGGSIGDLSDPLAGCYTASNGRLFFGGPRIRELTDAGMRNVSPTANNASQWADFAEPAFGLTAIGQGQQLALFDGVGWTVVAERGGLAEDPWLRGFALPDGRLALVGYEAFSVVSAGQIQSVRWPLGSARFAPWAVAMDSTGTVWVAGRFTKGEDTVAAVVGVKAN